MVAIAIYWRFANYAAEHDAEITFLSSLSGWGVLATYNIIDPAYSDLPGFHFLKETIVNEAIEVKGRAKAEADEATTMEDEASNASEAVN